MLTTLGIIAVALLTCYFVSDRLLRALLSRVARNRPVEISFSSIGPGSLKGLNLNFHRGPIACIEVDRMSLGRRVTGRTDLAVGSSRAWWATLPIFIKGLRVILRASPAKPVKQHVRQKSAKHQQGSRSLKGLQTWLGSALLGLLPSLPITVQDVSLSEEETGFIFSLKSVELTVRSVRLFKSIRAALTVTPISLSLKDLKGELEGGVIPVMTLGGIQLHSELCLSPKGPQIEAMRLEFGALDVILSMALLRVLSLYAHRRKRATPIASKEVKPRVKAKRIDVVDLCNFWPKKILVRLPAAQMNATDLKDGNSVLNASLGIGEVKLQGSNLDPAVSEGAEDYKLLLGVSAFQGKVQHGGGPQAVNVACPSFNLETKICSVQEEVENDSPIRAAVSGGFKPWSCQACPQEVWNTIAAVHRIGNSISDIPDEKPLAGSGINTDEAGSQYADSPEIVKDAVSASGNVLKGTETDNSWITDLGTDWNLDDTILNNSSGHDGSKPMPARPLILDLSIDFHQDSSLQFCCQQSNPLLTCSFSKSSLYASIVTKDLRAGLKELSTLRAGIDLAGGAARLPALGGHLEPWEFASLQSLTCNLQLAALGTESQLQGACVLNKPLLKLCETKLDLLARLISLSLPAPGLLGKRQKKGSRPASQGASRKKARLLPDLDLTVNDLEASYACEVPVPTEFAPQEAQEVDAEPQDISAQTLQLFTIGKVDLKVTQQLSAGSLVINDVQHSIECQTEFEQLSPHGTMPRKFCVVHLEEFGLQALRGDQRIIEDTAYREPEKSRHAVSLDVDGLKGQFAADPIIVVMKTITDLTRLRELITPRPIEDAANDQLEQNVVGSEQPVKIANESMVVETRTGGNWIKIIEQIDLSLTLSKIDLEAEIKDDVIWAATLQHVCLLYPSQNCRLADIVFMLNRSELINIKTVALCVHTLERQGIWPTPQNDSRSASIHLYQTDKTEDSQGGDSTTGRTVRRAIFSNQGQPAKQLATQKSKLPDAYKRAGLSAWADESPSDSAAATSEAIHSKAELTSLPKPLATVECHVANVNIILPYNQNPGTAQRYTELWVKAFQKALTVQFPRKAKAKKISKSAAGVGRPLEVRLAIRYAMFRMEHHPLEAWMAVKGPILRSTAAGTDLWENAAAAVREQQVARPPAVQAAAQLAAPASSLVKTSQHGSFSTLSGESSVGPSPVTSPRTGKREIEDLVHMEVFGQYKTLTSQAVVAHHLGTKGGALMHVEVESVEALVVLCPWDKASTEQAIKDIAKVDPASEGVPMRQVHKLHFDASLGSAAAFFSGSSKPLAAISRLGVAGALMTGRQITAPPKQTSRPMTVGALRTVIIPFTPKGSRALIKVYTDVKIDAGSPRVWYGMGLEPTIALVGQAGKRLSPTEFDKSKPKPVTLPWFDMLRFTWRGRADVKARNFEFALGCTREANLNPSVQRMQAIIPSASVEWREGSLLLTTEQLSASGYLAGDLEEPAGYLHALPLVDFPQMKLDLCYNWLLPEGRKAAQHHLFPVPVPEGEQGQIDIVRLYKATGIDLKLDVVLASKQGNISAAEEQKSFAEQVRDEQDPCHLPFVYIGGHQIAFMRLLAERLSCPPLWQKNVNRLGTYFQPMDRSRPPIKALPKLINRMDIAMRAAALEVVTYTVNIEEAACGIALTLPDLYFSIAVLLNLPAPKPIFPGYSAYSIKREQMAVRSAVLNLLVESANVLLRWREGDDDSRSEFKQSQEHLSNVMDDERKSVAHASVKTSQLLRSLVSGANASESFIASIDYLKLNEEKANPLDTSNAESEPLHITITNLRMLIDLETRNAIWAAVSHIIGAFRLPRQFTPFAPSFVTDNGQLPSRASSNLLKRRESMRGNQKGEKDSEEKVPELLTKLLRQNSAEVRPSTERSASFEEHSDHGSVDGDDSDDGHPRVVDPAKQRAEDEKVKAQLSEAHLKVREKAWHDVEKLWAKGDQKWNIELNGLQICLASEHAGGRFLLAMARATLCGRRLEPAALDTIQLDVSKVQALVAKTSIDPGSPAAWLQYADGKLEIQPTQSRNSLKEVFKPFSMKLWNSKMVKNHQHGQHIQVQRTSEELHLSVPFIDISMDSKEFNIMADVIHNVGLAPPPEVSPVNNDALLLNDAFSEELEAACLTYAGSRQHVHNLMAQVHTVASVLGMRLQKEESDGRRLYHTTSLNSTSMLTMQSSISERARSLAQSLDDVNDPIDAIQQYLVDRFDPTKNLLMDSGLGLQFILRCGQEQIQGARVAMTATAKALKDLRKDAEKLRQGRFEKRFLLELEGVTWSLCLERTPFAEIALNRVVMDNIRYKDQSGSTNLLVQYLEIKDATNSLVETPGTPKGAVLLPWNPTEDWKRDALLRVNVDVGTPTRSHTVYRHLEVTVHPLGVNLTETIAKRFWEYFFPKEEAIVSDRQEAWTKQSKPKSKPGRKSTSQYGVDNDVGPSPPSSVFSRTRRSQDQGEMPTSAHTSPGTTQTLAPRELHRRIRSESAWSAQPAVSPPDAERAASAGPGSPVVPMDWLQVYLARQNRSHLYGLESARRSMHRKNASIDSTATAISPLGPYAQDSRAGSGKKRGRKNKKAQDPATRKILFENVRTNRVHCRASYQGKPKNFTDFKLVLDNRRYCFEGEWKDLFQRMKWDSIKSALMSVFNLQGRKFREIFPEAARAYMGDDVKKISTKKAVGGFFMGLHKKIVGLDTPRIEPSKDTFVDRAKEKILLGSRHNKALPAPPVHDEFRRSLDASNPGSRKSLSSTHSFSAMLNSEQSTEGVSASGRSAPLLQRISEPSRSQSGSSHGGPSNEPSVATQRAQTGQPDEMLPGPSQTVYDSTAAPPQAALGQPQPALKSDFSYGTDIKEQRTWEWGRDVRQHATDPRASQGKEMAAARPQAGLDLKQLLQDAGAETADSRAGQPGAHSDTFQEYLHYPMPESRQPSAKSKTSKLFGKASKAWSKAGAKLQTQAQAVKRYVEEDFAKAAQMQAHYEERQRQARLAALQSLASQTSSQGRPRIPPSAESSMSQPSQATGSQPQPAAIQWPAVPGQQTAANNQQQTYTDRDPVSLLPGESHHRSDVQAQSNLPAPEDWSTHSSQETGHPPGLKQSQAQEMGPEQQGRVSAVPMHSAMPSPFQASRMDNMDGGNQSDPGKDDWLGLLLPTETSSKQAAHHQNAQPQRDQQGASQSGLPPDEHGPAVLNPPRGSEVQKPSPTVATASKGVSQEPNKDAVISQDLKPQPSGNPFAPGGLYSQLARDPSV